MPLILLILGAVLAYKLQAVMYRFLWGSGLSVDVSFKDAAAYEGDDSMLTETIVNRKLLPLPTLQVKFHINGALEFEAMENTAITDNTYRNDIFSIMPYERVTRKIPFHCKRRGFYHTSDVNLFSYDLFISEKFIAQVKNDSHFYIYPRQVNVNALNAPFNRLLGTLLTKRFYMDDPFEFLNIREYQVYDTMKDINWKASAKSGELKVNTHNYTASQEVTLLLNLESDTNWHFDVLAEESIRIAASYAAGLISKGIQTEIITNGIDVMTKKPLYIGSGADKMHMLSINEGLARLDISQQAQSFLPYLDAVLGDAYASQKLYVMISRVQSENLIETFSKISGISPGSQWICPLYPDMTYVLSQLGSFDCMRWEVPYGRE